MQNRAHVQVRHRMLFHHSFFLHPLQVVFVHKCNYVLPVWEARVSFTAVMERSFAETGPESRAMANINNDI